MSYGCSGGGLGGQRGSDCGRDLRLKGRGGFSHPKRNKNYGLELEQAAVDAAATATENETEVSKDYLTVEFSLKMQK
jgi:hypothetical protein